MKKYPIILGIETSCDDTGASIIKNSYIISNIVYSQNIHKKYGGVVPELAARLHEKNILKVVKKAFTSAKIIQEEINAIAFTIGPGLIGSLIVGSSFAKSLSLALNIPLIGVNHIQAHTLVNFIKDKNHIIPKFPYLCLMISGGNTQIIKVDDFFQMSILGETIDDAVGETFDKLAKILGFKYPGGHLIDKYAKMGNYNKFIFSKPNVKGLNFSFSGLKTNVLYFIQKKLKYDTYFIKNNIYDLCASIQKTIIEILISKITQSVIITGINRIALAGGVASNYFLREQIKHISLYKKWKIYIPNINYCIDNAAMIAMVGEIKYNYNMFDELNIIPYNNYNITYI